MEAEPGIHVTLKFHLPYRLVSVAPADLSEAMGIASEQTALLIASLVAQQAAQEVVREVYVPPPLQPPNPPREGNPNDGEECLACQ